jgi:hypothetical protein
MALNTSFSSHTHALQLVPLAHCVHVFHLQEDIYSKADNSIFNVYCNFFLMWHKTVLGVQSGSNNHAAGILPCIAEGVCGKNM